MLSKFWYDLNLGFETKPTFPDMANNHFHGFFWDIDKILFFSTCVVISVIELCFTQHRFRYLRICIQFNLFVPTFINFITIVEIKSLVGEIR